MKVKRPGTLLVTVLVLLAGGVAGSGVTAAADAPSASTAESIEYGQTVSGNVTTSDSFIEDYPGYGYHDNYTFTAEEGDQVSIELRLDDRFSDEGELALYAPNGERVAIRSHNAEDGNAVITREEIEQPGTYTVVVTGRVDDATFGYDLSLYEGIPVDQSLAYGDTVTGSLDRSDRYLDGYPFNGYHDTYAFEASEGDEVSVEMRPDDRFSHEGELSLYAPNGDLILSESHNAEDGNAVITREEVEQPGTYKLVVTHDGGDESERFDYELSIYEGLPNDGTVAYGDSVTGDIDRSNRYLEFYEFNGYHETYAFNGSTGDEVSVEVRPDDKFSTDARVSMFDPTGETVTIGASNADEGNAVITRETLERDGTYQLVVTNGGASDVQFDYTLSVYEGLPRDGHVSYGENVSGTVDASDRYLDDYDFRGYHETYAFNGSAGDVVSAELRTPDNLDTDTQLTLLDEDGEEVTAGFANADEGNAVITREELQSDGEYLLVVTNADSYSGDLDYTLSVYEGLPAQATLEYDDEVSGNVTTSDRYLTGTNFDGYHDVYAFDGSDGDVVNVTLTPTSQNDAVSKVVLIDPSGDRVTYDNGDSTTGVATITEEELSATGTYRVVVTDYDWASETETYDYDLSLEAEGTELQAVVGSNPPTDPDGDGLYEDVNGDGQATFGDAIELAFVNGAGLTDAQQTALDFDADGDVDFDDAISLAFAV
ncbi:MAG: hypothetical protein ACQETI_10165 [Halobacteriota archaeon]